MFDISEHLQKNLGIRRVESVSFVEISPSVYDYRDAIQFGNDRKVLLQALGEGARFEVLSLGMSEPELEQDELRVQCF